MSDVPESGLIDDLADEGEKAPPFGKKQKK